MDIRERFLQSIDHLEAHLFEPVALAEAATRAELSPHYFSRLFRVLTGETFGAYRSQPRIAPFFFRGRIGPELLSHLKEVLDMQPEIREIDAFTVVGVRQRFDHETKHGIPELWQRFVPLLSQIPHRRPDVTFGVCSNGNPADGSFDYMAGVAVDKVDRLPPGLVAETVPRQTYAVFTHHVQSTNLHEELQPTMRWIWGTWLREAPYEYLNTPDFERYPPEFDPDHGKGFLEICLPVRPKT